MSGRPDVDERLSKARDETKSLMEAGLIRDPGLSTSSKKENRFSFFNYAT